MLKGTRAFLVLAFLVGSLHAQEVQSVHTIKVSVEGIKSLSFSSDGKILACGGRDSSVVTHGDKSQELYHGNNLVLVDPVKGHQTSILNADKGRIVAVAFSPNSETLATLKDGLVLNLWDAKTGKHIAKIPERSDSDIATALAFSPDGKTVVCGGFNSTMTLVDVPTQKIRSRIKIGEHTIVRSLAFSPNGETLAVGSGNGDLRDLSLWDMGSQTRILSLKGHEKPVTGLSFSSDGKLLASSGADWTTERPKNNFRFSFGSTRAITSSGRLTQRKLFFGRSLAGR